MKNLLWFTFLASSVMVSTVFGQSRNDWRGIVPLVSKCEDVIKILKIKTCEEPTTTVSSPDKRIIIRFVKPGDDWAVTAQTVASVAVIYNSSPRLIELLKDRGGFERKAESETPDVIRYVNDETGWSLSVQKGSDGVEYVRDVSIRPSKANMDKFLCKKNEPVR